MEIVEAKNYRESIAAMLETEKLPASDLPAVLENFIVAKQNDEVIGAIGIERYGNYSLLRSMVVKHDFRGQGIASKLIKQIEDLALEQGSGTIFLLTETAPGYFSRKGYKKIGRADVPAEIQQSSEFSFVCPQSAVVMMKTLSA